MLDDHDVLTSFLQLEDDEVLTNWVVIYETKAVDGHDRLGYQTNEACTPWNAEGMMRWAYKLQAKREFKG